MYFFLLQLKETKSTLKGETSLQFNDQEAQLQLRVRRIMVSFVNFPSNLKITRNYVDFVSFALGLFKKITLHSQVTITIRCKLRIYRVLVTCFTAFQEVCSCLL